MAVDNIPVHRTDPVSFLL